MYHPPHPTVNIYQDGTHPIPLLPALPAARGRAPCAPRRASDTSRSTASRPLVDPPIRPCAAPPRRRSTAARNSATGPAKPQRSAACAPTAKKPSCPPICRVHPQPFRWQKSGRSALDLPRLRPRSLSASQGPLRDGGGRGAREWKESDARVQSDRTNLSLHYSTQKRLAMSSPSRQKFPCSFVTIQLYVLRDSGVNYLERFYQFSLRPRRLGGELLQ